MSTSTNLAPFSFDNAAMKSHFDEHGWFYAQGGTTPELLSTITEQVAELMDQGSDLADWRYPEKKEQFLWDLPAGLTADSLCRSVANATGLNPDRTRIAERHLKVYSATAPETPPAHKDRSASMITVGIGIDIPEDSRLVIWPNDHNEPNPYPTSQEWRATREPNELPEVVLASLTPTEVNLQRGDVVMFRGAEIYHERHRPASTTVLYLKFNDCDLDPLGEDPRTVDAETLSNERSASGIPSDATIRVSPRVIGLRTDNLFPTGEPQRYARMFGYEPGIPLSETEANLVAKVLQTQPAGSSQFADTEADAAERLVRLGILLLD